MQAIAGLTGGGIIYTKGNLRVIFDKSPSVELSIRHEILLDAVENRTIIDINGGGLLSFPNREIATISVGDKIVNLEWEIFLNRLRG